MPMQVKKGQGKKSSKPKGAKTTETIDKKAGVNEPVVNVHNAGSQEPTDLAPGQYATVYVSLGARIGLPNYSDVRVGCSISIPCPPTNEEIDGTYEFAREWCFQKVEDLTSKALESDDDDE